MPILKWGVAGSLAVALEAFAQAQQAPQPEPKAAPASTPAGADAQQGVRLPASGRNQFSTPVMNIDIKGEGLALPTGVAPAEEPLAKPPDAPAPATAK